MCDLSAGFAGEWDYVVGFEAVDYTAILVFGIEHGFKSGVIEVCGEVGESAVGDCLIGPQFVTGMEEVGYDGECVDSVEGAVFDADVVEAKVVGVYLESVGAFFVVGVEVDVVIQGEVVDHLCNGDVDEVAGILCATQIFAEYLHEECLAGSFLALEHDIFMELIAAAGEHFFGERASIEIVQEKAEDVAVVLVDFEAPILRFEYYFVGDEHYQCGVSLINIRVGEILSVDICLPDFFCGSSYGAIEGQPRFGLFTISTSEGV